MGEDGTDEAPVLILESYEGEDRGLVVAVERNAERVPTRAIGYDVEWAGLSALLAAGMEGGPLLPQPLADRVDEGNLVYIAVRSPSGALLYRSDEMPDGAIVANHNLDSRLGSLALQAGLRREAAEQLIIGGLPGSSGWELLALLACTGALVASGFLLLRKERQLSRMRESFVASISHELRTPLAQIRLFAETMLLGRVRSEEES